jgi:hypothetical protein
MPLRILLSLTLLLQPLTLRGAADAPEAACDDTACCQVIETFSCCGQPVKQRYCSKSGGECRCGIGKDDSKSSPAAPPTPPRNDFTSQVFTAYTGPALVAPAAVRTLTPPALTGLHRTHNETQALLCIWRT